MRRRFLSHFSRATCSTRWSSTSPPVPPTTDDVEKIVAALEKSEALMEGVVSHMQPNARRRLVVTGGTLEWFGKEHVAREMATADADQDHVISPKDFDHWFANALKRKSDESTKHSEAQSNNANVDVSEKQVPLSALLLIAFEAGLPFVGFGFLDNATMIVAGDAIDHSLGFFLGCSVMASAAMGNVVSGVMGMQVHGMVEKAVERLNLKTPVLTEEQRKGRRVFLAGHLGGTIGIMTGLLLGMLPLLLISKDDEAKSDIASFQKWDRNKNGVLDVSEILAGLNDMGFRVEQSAIERIVRGYSPNGRLNVDQFRALLTDLRQHKHVVN